MKAFSFHQSVILVASVALLLSGCRSGSNYSPAVAGGEAASVDLATARSRARELNRALVVLVVERGASRADDKAQALLGASALGSYSASVVTCVLDLSVSRNRAIAAQFHALTTPLLACLSPRGIMVSRDERPLRRRLVLARVGEALKAAPELDRRFAFLQGIADKDPHDAGAQMDLAGFLLGQHNAAEAIPHLAAVAHSTSDPPAVRLRAWVALARAHLWIGEPEKAREEAKELIATLGRGIPEAQAGGDLVLGIHDANLKRPSLARREFQEAIALAPGSPYAKAAAAMLHELQKGWQPK